MLVILTEQQVISPKQVCQGCLLANSQGLPRWNQGKLSCGYAVGKLGGGQPPLYQCQMGFRIANID
jgi:hypothetical protein